VSDRRLQEAFVKDAARQAEDLVTRALSKLKSVSTATGDHRFEAVFPELERVRDRIVAAAEVTDGPPPTG
jgi:hypothetical protein